MNRATLPLALLALWTAGPLRAQEQRSMELPADQSAPPELTELGQETCFIEMKSFGGRPVISAKINGQGPWDFILDTGCSLSAIIDASVIEELEIEPGEALPFLGMEAHEVWIETIQFGELALSGVASVSTKTGRMVSGMNTTKGILGIGLFADCLLTFDFPEKQFVVALGELPEADQEEILAYQSEGFIEFDADVAGVQIPMHLDTGSPGDLMLINRYDKKLPLTAEPTAAGSVQTPMGGATVRNATLDGLLKIGRHEFTNPKLRFADLPQMTRSGAGNIGSGLLQHFAITLDQQNRRLRFHRSEESNGG